MENTEFGKKIKLNWMRKKKKKNISQGIKSNRC